MNRLDPFDKLPDDLRDHATASAEKAKAQSRLAQTALKQSLDAFRDERISEGDEEFVVCTALVSALIESLGGYVGGVLPKHIRPDNMEHVAHETTRAVQAVVAQIIAAAATGGSINRVEINSRSVAEDDKRRGPTQGDVDDFVTTAQDEMGKRELEEEFPVVAELHDKFLLKFTRAANEALNEGVKAGEDVPSVQTAISLVMNLAAHLMFRNLLGNLMEGQDGCDKRSKMIAHKLMRASVSGMTSTIKRIVEDSQGG